MVFLQWCQDLAARGMKVDGKPFSLGDRPALVPLYQAIPLTWEEARDFFVVVQKGAQLGLTIWEVLASLYRAKRFAPFTMSMFLPDQALAAHKSEHRLLHAGGALGAGTLPRVDRARGRGWAQS